MELCLSCINPSILFQISKQIANSHFKDNCYLSQGVSLDVWELRSIILQLA